MQKSVCASLLFNAILTALLNLELDEWLLATDSDSERFTSKYNHICAKHELSTCFLKIYMPFGYFFRPIFICNPCFLREIYNGDFQFLPLHHLPLHHLLTNWSVPKNKTQKRLINNLLFNTLKHDLTESLKVHIIIVNGQSKATVCVKSEAGILCPTRSQREALVTSSWSFLRAFPHKSTSWVLCNLLLSLNNRVRALALPVCRHNLCKTPRNGFNSSPPMNTYYLRFQILQCFRELTCAV